MSRLATWSYSQELPREFQMTEAANYYLTSGSNPSIFEIIAQKSLNVTIEPALRKVAEFVSSCSPKYCSWVFNRYDESFLILNGSLQYHYLKHYGASFSEYFYGLKRLRLHEDCEITLKQKRLSWIFIVVVPYLKRKFDDSIAEYRLQEAEKSLPVNYEGKLKKALIYLQSAFEIVWSSWTIVNYLRYMSNKSEAQLPALWLLNMKLVYSNVPEDFYTFWSALLRGNLSLSELSVGLVQNAVRSTLEISAFFVQFLQVWNNEKANFSVTALPPATPPPLDTKANQYTEKCPICLQQWRIPTVLPVSGYVFCFSCIYKHLRETRRCPVTNLPAKPLDIIRLYQ